MIAATLQTESAINLILSSLPPETKFDVRRMDPTVFPVLGYSLTSDTRSLVELRDVALYQIRPALSTIPGVASIGVLGGETAEYQRDRRSGKVGFVRTYDRRRRHRFVGIQRDLRRRPPRGSQQAVPDSVQYPVQQLR